MKTSDSKPTTPIIDVIIEETTLFFVLIDGRKISAPLADFPRLRDATTEQKHNWRLIGTGIGVHWPEIDEDIALATLLQQSKP